MVVSRYQNLRQQSGEMAPTSRDSSQIKIPYYPTPSSSICWPQNYRFVAVLQDARSGAPSLKAPNCCGRRDDYVSSAQNVPRGGAIPPPFATR
jgi:hypothetical protein